MIKLETKDDLQRLVDEGLEESLVLEYKASNALSRESAAVTELCKDVSAFANSAGGQLIYGIEEDKVTRKPARVDDGVEDQKITREWIDQILNSRVQPPMDGVRIGRIPLDNGRFGYVITVPATQSGSHQAPDRKYYKQSDLQSVPMQDYEIRDVMRRSTTPQPFVKLLFGGGASSTKLIYDPDKESSRGVPLHAQISNRSSEPAMYTQVTIGIDDGLDVVSIGEYQKVGTRQEGKQRFNLLRRQWSVADRFPIFKEATFYLVDVPVSVAVPAAYIQAAQCSISLSTFRRRVSAAVIHGTSYAKAAC